MSSHRYRPMTVALLGAAVLLTACGGSTASSTNANASVSKAGNDAPVSGGAYVHALEADPTGCLDPAQQRFHVALNITRQLSDSLVDQDPTTGAIVPWLAKKWEVSADAKSFTFHLITGATFSDGQPINAAAVKANLDRIVALGPKATGASPWIQGYVGTKVVDPQTATVTFSSPNVQFLQALADSWFGLISPKDTGKSAAELCKGTYAGSGPFTLVEYVKNQHALLAGRSGYHWPSSLAKHQGEAYLKTLEFTFVTESGVRAGSLQSGQIDSASLIAWQDETPLKAAGITLLKAFQPGLTETWIPNQQSWLAKDAPVRQAIRFAINSQEIVDTVYGPSYRSRTSVLNSTTPGYSDNSADLAFDAAKSKALLTADGWIPGPDGIRVKNGKRLTLNVVASYTASTTRFANSTPPGRLRPWPPTTMTSMPGP